MLFFDTSIRGQYWVYVHHLNSSSRRSNTLMHRAQHITEKKRKHITKLPQANLRNPSLCEALVIPKSFSRRFCVHWCDDWSKLSYAEETWNKVTTKTIASDPVTWNHWIWVPPPHQFETHTHTPRYRQTKWAAEWAPCGMRPQHLQPSP